MKDYRVRALGMVLSHPGCNAADVANVLDVSHPEATNVLKGLAKENLVFSVGTGRRHSKVGWYVTEE